MTAQSRGTISQGICDYYVSGQSVNGGLGKGEKFYFLSPSIGPSFVPQHFISPTFSGWASMGAVWVIKQLDLSSPRERISGARGEEWNNQARGKCSPVCSRDTGFTGTKTGVEGVAKNLLGDNETEKVDMVQKTCLIE